MSEDNKAAERLKALEDKLDNVVGKLKVAETENTKLSGTIKTLEEEKTAVSESVTKLTEENSKLKKDNAKLTESVDTLTTAKSKLEDDIEKRRIADLAKSTLGDYNFKNKYEEQGFNAGLFSKKEGKFLTDEEVKNHAQDFLKSAKPSVDDDKNKQPPDDKNKNTDNNNNNKDIPDKTKTPSGETKTQLATKIANIMNDGIFTQEKAKEVRILEKQIETMDQQ
jgi:septation ring formation regulator EzrA